MSKKILLREICHARSGDKGNAINVGVVCYKMEDYPLVRELLTVSRVSEYFGDWIEGPVERYELPKIGALNFVLHGALGGGVSRSARADGHGKSFGTIILGMELEIPG